MVLSGLILSFGPGLTPLVLNSPCADRAWPTPPVTAAGVIKEASVMLLVNLSPALPALSTLRAAQRVFPLLVVVVLFKEPAIVTTHAHANPTTATMIAAVRSVLSIPSLEQCAATSRPTRRRPRSAPATAMVHAFVTLVSGDPHANARLVPSLVVKPAVVKAPVDATVSAFARILTRVMHVNALKHVQETIEPVTSLVMDMALAIAVSASAISTGDFWMIAAVVKSLLFLVVIEETSSVMARAPASPATAALPAISRLIALLQTVRPA